jgi:hypothetical protein
MLTSGEYDSRAALARKVGVTRARVTQVLGLLLLDPRAVACVVALGDPLAGPVVTERRLRALAGRAPDEQLAAVRRMVNKAAAGGPAPT